MRRAPDISWQDRALCIGDDPDEYDEVIGSQGRQVCFRCPVQARCLEYALLTDERYGLWGGAHPEDRRRLNKLVGPLSAQEIADYYVRTGDAPKQLT